MIGCAHNAIVSALTEETRDWGEQINALHCLQASEPLSGVDETMLEVAP